MKPLYVPRGKAKEYGDYAVNIYTGCPHRCYYCFAPNVLRKDREAFHTNVHPRDGIVDALRKQLEREGVTDQLIHLCFTCDPYPTGYDSTATREVIKAIKESGNHVQILTKGDGRRDFDLLDGNDWYGITLDGITGGICGGMRVAGLTEAYRAGIKTWISFEPVIDEQRVLKWMELFAAAKTVNRVKIGKLNYYPSDIDWNKFGHEAEELCKKYGQEYYIKDGLREEMNRESD